MLPLYQGINVRMNLSLRPYQQEAVENCIRFHKEKKNSQLMILPTGTGKTITFCSIIKFLGYRTLILSHTSQLKRQIAQECLKHCKDQFCVSQTIQWICKGENLLKIMKQHFDLLIIDESHHAFSESYQNVIKLFKSKSKLLIGCTATPFRLDKQSIYKIFPYVICKKNITEMIEDGYLSDIKGYRVKTNIDLKGVRIKAGDFNIRQLSSIINTSNRNDIILFMYNKILSNKKTVIFCVSISHCDEVSKKFREDGIQCKSVHGKIKREDVFKILHEFKIGKISCITTCQMLTEGFDEPTIEALMICRPTKSPGLYIQMIGRGLRISPNKKYCEIVELTDNAHDICSFETLSTEKTVSKSFDKREKFESIKDIKQTVEIDAKNLVVEEENFFSNYGKKNMSIFQRDFMEKHKIPFIEPLTYEIADIIIRNHKVRL